MSPALLRIFMLAAFGCLAATDIKAQRGYYFRRARLSESSKYHRFHRLDYNRAKAAGENLNGYLRGEDVLSLLFSSFRYTRNYSSFGNELAQQKSDVDTTIVFDNWKPKIAIGGGVSTGTPITDLGENAALIFSYGISINYFQWKIDSLHLGTRYFSSTDRLLQFGIPLTLDYRTGCDAMLDKSKRTSMTFGAGILPMASFSNVEHSISGSAYRIYPYLKAEFGLMAGICFKLRASCWLGNTDYLTTDVNIINNEQESFTLSGKSVFALSLVMMPLAFDWNGGGWYR